MGRIFLFMIRFAHASISQLHPLSPHRSWIWIGYLIAMAVMDFALYTPQVQRVVLQPDNGQQQVQPLLPTQFRPEQPARKFV